MVNRSYHKATLNSDRFWKATMTIIADPCEFMLGLEGLSLFSIIVLLKKFALNHSLLTYSISFDSFLFVQQKQKNMLKVNQKLKHHYLIIQMMYQILCHY